MYVIRLAAIAGFLFFSTAALTCPSPLHADDRNPRSESLRLANPDVELNQGFASPQQRTRFRGGPTGVYKSRINAHWLDDDARFWYRNDLPGRTKEFILVDTQQGTRELAFDHELVAQQMGSDVQASQLPITDLEYSQNGQVVTLIGNGMQWSLDLSSGELSEPTELAEAASDSDDRSREGRRRGFGRFTNNRSPDGKWTAFERDHNVFLRGNGELAEELQLSTDGTEDNSYGRFSWSPDSQTLLAWRIRPGDRKEVHLVRSSPEDGGRAEHESRSYALPGDSFAQYEANLFDVANRQQIKPEVDRFEHQWLSPRAHWTKGGNGITYSQDDRGHQRFRVIHINRRTGDVRNVIDEQSDTYIWTTHAENLRLDIVNWLAQSDEIIYVSEMDGWRHMYLADIETGELQQITKGQWVIRGIERIDEENRQIWFSASGKNPDQDPYFLHHYRINFDGSGLVALTEGNGNHSIEYSPTGEFLIDTWSRVDQAPVNQLRRTSDGRLVCDLEEADISELEAGGWQAPEVFVAKGRDGKTDIWGNIYRPTNLDPNKHYPVIEDIYAGPQGSFVPKSFSSRSRYQSLNELGFIVVKIDGMGTANRSKAFHDVCYKNLKDGGFEDRILWMQAAAEKYPYMDLSRVGIYGTSAGGQNAAGAVLFHPEFYKAAVAACGCHDNRMDKASWNEQWMGYMPPDKIWENDAENWYSQCSNIDNAHRLQGNLFLIVGEMDSNVPPESTMRFVDALIRADKDFGLLVIPNAGHGMGGRYGQRRMQDFFVRHLIGEQPPNRNAP